MPVCMQRGNFLIGYVSIEDGIAKNECERSFTGSAMTFWWAEHKNLHKTG